MRSSIIALATRSLLRDITVAPTICNREHGRHRSPCIWQIFSSGHRDGLYIRPSSFVGCRRRSLVAGLWETSRLHSSPYLFAVTTSLPVARFTGLFGPLIFLATMASMPSPFVGLLTAEPDAPRCTPVVSSPACASTLRGAAPPAGPHTHACFAARLRACPHPAHDWASRCCARPRCVYNRAALPVTQCARVCSRLPALQHIRTPVLCACACSRLPWRQLARTCSRAPPAPVRGPAGLTPPPDAPRWPDAAARRAPLARTRPAARRPSRTMAPRRRWASTT